MNASRGVVGYKIPQYMANKTDDLFDLIIRIANDQGLCNLPLSKVMVYYGTNE